MYKFVKKIKLKKYYYQYKPFLLFLGSFFLSYILLTSVYQYYLSGFETNKVDGITRIVSNNTAWILSYFTTDSYVLESGGHAYMKLFYQNHYVARIVEGCNAVSVLILFSSFVISFAGRWIVTLCYVVGGCVLIYILNVCRIAALSALIFNYPEQEHFLHGVIFPLSIYGVVFLLWLVWVRKFSRYAQ